MMRKFQQHSFGSTCKRLLSLFAIVLFLLTFVPEVVESRRGGFGGGRSFSRSSSRSYSRSSSSRSYSTPKRSTSSSSSRSSYTKPRSTGSSYSGNRTTGTTSTRNSTTARQKQTATNSAKTTNTTSTRNSTATRSQQGRKQVRQLKSENRSLKRKVTTANRQTSQARRQQRSTITVNNFGGYYPMTGYSMYSLQRSMMFNNLLFGIYFHDYYNHSIRHSYLWHYHHRDYDRSHWDAKKQAEYEHYKEYYENQGVEPSANYVDPDTNRDEDFAATYVEENPDKFYGDNVEVVTVDELPDEAALKQELIASAETPTVTTNTQRASPSQRIIVEKSTSGGTWFVLIFGGLLIVGGIMLVMYNKGYF